MRFTAVLAISLLGVSSALGQSAPASSAQPAVSQTTSADAPPEHPITPEQVHEILELTHANEIARQAMRQSMGIMRQELPPYMPADVVVDLEQALMKINFESLEVAAFQRHISTEDAAQIIAFYKSSAGHNMLAAMPEITREVKATAASEGARIARQVIQAHMEEIKASAKKYQEEHSGQPKVITPN